MNEPTLVSTIERLIDSREFQKALRVNVEGLHLAFQLILKESDPKIPWRVSREQPGLSGSLTALVREHIIDKLPTPSPITLADLMPLLISAFTPYAQTHLSFEDGFKRFRNSIHEIPLCYRQTPPTPIVTGYFLAVMGGEYATGFPSPIDLLETESGFALSLIGVLPAESNPYEPPVKHCVYAQARWTECSTGALQKAVALFTPVLATLIRSAELLYSLNRTIDSSDGRAGNIDKIREKLLADAGQVPLLVLDGELHHFFSFIPHCLAAYPVKPSRKDSMSRRIRNATQLLVLADQQLEESESLKLALSVAAMEALVCRKGSDLTKQFSENIVALLEPDPRKRSFAVKFCSKLYSLRSEVLHGTGFNPYRDDIDNSRVLAGAVLKAIVERRGFVRRMEGKDEDPNSLIGELVDDKYTEGQLTGVEESPAGLLWSNQE